MTDELSKEIVDNPVGVPDLFATVHCALGIDPLTEGLAAISANLSEVYQRHKRLLRGNLRFNQNAWGLIDAAGNSEVGFWPLYIGYNQFTLVIHGMPQLNRPAFKQLVWSLMRRYGATT